MLRPTRSALRLLLLAAFALPAASCHKGGPGDELAADGGTPELPGPGEILVHEVGAPGQAPERLVIRSGTSLFDETLLGGAALEGTVLQIEPAVEGQLLVTERDELAFVPTRGFVPGTTYTARLTALATLDQTLLPAEGQDWSRTFTVPPLGLVRLSPHRRDRLAGTAALDLVFSAAVDVEEVARRLEVQVDGEPMAPARVEQGDGPQVVRVHLEGERVAAETAEVEVALAPGLPWAWDAAVVAEAAQATVRLVDGQPIEIKAAMVKEGADGHYLEIVCHDPSVGGQRWYWDRDTWDGWDVSPRCLLDEDEARAAIHVSRGGPVSIAPGAAGFRIFGDFDRGEVELTIDAGVRTVDGGMLPLAYEATLEVPGRKPRLSFLAKGRYLPRSAWRSLAVEHVNVPKARLVVRHVPPQNLAFWLSGQESADERVSNVILDQEIALAGGEDELTTSQLDVGALIPDAGQGVYQVLLEGAGEAWEARDASRLLLTDMQIIAKRAATPPGSAVPPEVRAWVVGMHDNAPMSGVELQLVRPSGQVLSTCRTGSDGGCLLAVPDPGADPTPPMAVLARRGEDLSYLKFADVRVEAEADLSGAPYRSDAAYLAAAWSDRGVYRPGDEVHVAGLVREDGFSAPSAGLPVVVRITDPQQREIRKQALATNAAGMVSLDLTLADFATTGAWQVALEVADRTVGSMSFQVEEFVPERMAVQARAAQAEGVLVGEEIPVDVGAQWLFGGNAGGSRVEVDCRLEAGRFVPGGGSDASSQGRWSYGLAFVEESPPPALQLGTVEDVLDEEGQGRIACPAAGPGAALLGSAELVARVAVFEGDSGRATRETARAPVHPARHYLGVTTKSDEVASGGVIAVEGKVVGWDGSLAAGALSQVEVRLYRMEAEYSWVWDEDLGDTSYRRTQRRIQEELRTVPVAGGRFQAELRPVGDASGWLVDVRGGGARTERYVEGSGSDWYWDPWTSTVDQTPRPQKPTYLEVKAPELAQVGETVTVTTKAPYAGRMLLTVETDRVQHHAWKDVQAGLTEWTVPLHVDDGEGGTFAPNVYVTALLLKDPHLESARAFLPDRAFGATSVRIQPRQFALDLGVTAPAESRPWEPLKVSLQAGPVEGPTFATVAVVDEGILQLTDFETPDPRDQIFARRRLEVDSFETIGWTLLDQPAGPSSRTGGDGAGKGIGRVQMVKPVALWSGLVPVPATGQLDLSFDIPGYRGKLRVMAVVASPGRMGAAEASVVVREPIVLQTTLPRFLVAGDEARIPVRLTNTTTKDRDVTVEVQVQEIDLGLPPAATPRGPAVELVKAPSGTLHLAPDASGNLVFSIAARRAPSAVKLVVTARAGDLRSREELDLPVTHAEPEVWRHQLVALTGDSTNLAPALAGWKPGTDRSRVWITASEHAQALTHLGHLVRYPYGCIEQTTSSTRPLLYVRGAVESIDPSLLAKGSVDDMVKAGLERVLSMQTPSGGFAYWPGGDEPSEWGTAYGTHLLLDAKAQGFEVPPEALDDAMDWLESRFGGRTSPDDGVAYAHYVLALGGRARPAAALRVIEALDALPVDARQPWVALRRSEDRYLLMAALHKGGDRRYEAQLKRLSDFDEVTLRVNDWTFWSALRGAGLRLSVFQDLFGTDPAGDAAAARLAAWVGRQGSGMYTTQELAWAITALGKRATAGAALGGTPALLVDGRPVTPRTADAWAIDLAAGARTAVLQTPGRTGKAWALVSTRGVRTDDPVPVGGNGLALTRTWLDAAGQVLDPARLPLGTPLYVRVDLENLSGRYQQNLALVDRLPAGWEIENPRLSGNDLPEWAQELTLWEAEHMNLRDDRVEVFGRIDSGETRSILYGARAVTSGRFVVPPVSAEAMYDPDIWARRAGRTVEVVGPWDEGVL